MVLILPIMKVEALLFVNIGDDALTAKNMEALLFVNTGDDALTARNVEALLFVNMGDSALCARNVDALVCKHGRQRHRCKECGSKGDR